MKVVCIKKFVGRIDSFGRRVPMVWEPQVDCVYTVVDEKVLWGCPSYSLAEGPPRQYYEASAFRPLDFGDKVCDELEKEFVEELEEELV